MEEDPVARSIRQWVLLEKRRRALWKEYMEVREEQMQVKRKVWKQIPEESRKKIVIQPSSGGMLRFGIETSYSPLTQRFLKESLHAWNPDLDIEACMKYILNRRMKKMEWNIYWDMQK